MLYSDEMMYSYIYSVSKKCKLVCITHITVNVKTEHCMRVNNLFTLTWKQPIPVTVWSIA